MVFDRGQKIWEKSIFSNNDNNLCLRSFCNLLIFFIDPIIIYINSLSTNFFFCSETHSGNEPLWANFLEGWFFNDGMAWWFLEDFWRKQTTVPGSCKSFSDWCLKLHAAVCVFAYAVGFAWSLAWKPANGNSWWFLNCLALYIHYHAIWLMPISMYIHKCTYVMYIQPQTPFYVML